MLGKGVTAPVPECGGCVDWAHKRRLKRDSRSMASRGAAAFTAAISGERALQRCGCDGNALRSGIRHSYFFLQITSQHYAPAGLLYIWVMS